MKNYGTVIFFLGRCTRASAVRLVRGHDDSGAGRNGDVCCRWGELLAKFVPATVVFRGQ